MLISPIQMIIWLSLLKGITIDVITSPLWKMGSFYFVMKIWRCQQYFACGLIFTENKLDSCIKITLKLRIWTVQGISPFEVYGRILKGHAEVFPKAVYLHEIGKEVTSEAVQEWLYPRGHSQEYWMEAHLLTFFKKIKKE